MRDVFHPKRLWAIYEPRSATSRRNVYQNAIAEALSLADCIAIPELYKPEKIPENERLNLNRLTEDLHKAGCRVWNLQSVENVIKKVSEEVQPEDLIVIMSNGGFGDIYTRLPAALKRKYTPGNADTQEIIE